MPEVGFLVVGSGTLLSMSRFEEFTRALKTLGYVDGKNIALKYLTADGELKKLPSLPNRVIQFQ